MIAQCTNLKEKWDMCLHEDTSSEAGPMEVCELGLQCYREAMAQGSVSREVPGCLLALGLLRPMPDSPSTLVPVPPDIVARELARPHERAIEVQQDALAALRSSLFAAENAYRAQREVRASIQRLVGEDVISSALRSAVESCRDELLTAQPGGSRDPALLEEALARDVALLGRGVRQRTLYQHTVRSHGPTLSYIDEVVSRGAEVRTLDEVLERIIVCDQTTAFIPGEQERRYTALAVHDPGVIRYLVMGFEHAWQRAEPLGHAQQGRSPLLTDEVRRAVLRLMVDGHTDEAVATRLGMSIRTVATHIRKTADLLGSRSRAQLAYLLAQSGELEDHPKAGPGSPNVSTTTNLRDPA